MDESLSLRDLEALYESLDGEGRDELLKCLLIAVSRGREHVQDLLGPLAFEASVRADLTSL